MTNTEIARIEGATHQSALDANKFFKQEKYQTLACRVDAGEFNGWVYWSTYPPEYATGEIA